MRLNLGSGWDRRDGYVNVDFLLDHQPDVVADVLRLPFSGVAEEILAQDVLEHLPRTSTRQALLEWRRAALPGALALIRVPSLFHATDVMRAANDLATHELLVQNLYGTQAYTGDVHLTSFTDLTMSAHLHDSGWRDVQGELRDDWMWEVTARAGQGADVAVFWGSGCYPLEGNQWGTWRWLARSGEVALIGGSTVETAVLAFELDAGHAAGGDLRLRVDGKEVVARSGEDVRVPVTLAPSQRCALTFLATFDPVGALGDSRDLRCRLVNPRLESSA